MKRTDPREHQTTSDGVTDEASETRDAIVRPPRMIIDTGMTDDFKVDLKISFELGFEVMVAILILSCAAMCICSSIFE